MPELGRREGKIHRRAGFRRSRRGLQVYPEIKRWRVRVPLAIPGKENQQTFLP